jgi:hypothetical protein
MGEFHCREVSGSNKKISVLAEQNEKIALWLLVQRYCCDYGFVCMGRKRERQKQAKEQTEKRRAAGFERSDTFTKP